MAGGRVILSHGLESGPEATKVQALAAVATARGWRCIRPDYRDLSDWRARVERLRTLVAAEAEPCVLVGSSLGAWISAKVSLEYPTRALLLLAPPVRLPDAPEGLHWSSPRVCLIHGWRDELIPAAEVLQLAAAARTPVLMVDDDHRLHASLALIEVVFGHWLDTCEAL